MSSESPQTITALTEADELRLREQRAVVEQFIRKNEENLRKYESVAGKLGTIRAILQAGVFKPDQTYELQCLGVVLGDAHVQHLGMEWIIVQDARGRVPAIRVPSSSIIVYPLTMISKRIERGEEVNVFDLFAVSADSIEHWMAQGV